MRVVAAIIERGDRVLLALRPAGKLHGGMWEFPGGKVEANETDFEALRRELAEELGLRVTSTSSPAGAFQDPDSDFWVVFIPVTTDNEPECREHSAIQWVTWSDIEAMPLAPTDRRFANMQAG